MMSPNHNPEDRASSSAANFSLRSRMDDVDDEKREAAISSVIAAVSLKPKLSLSNPSSSSAAAVTQSRISKFQELHNRRIQIKEKSKIKMKKSKGRSSLGPSRLQEKAEKCTNEAQGMSTCISLDGQQDNVLSTTKDVVVPKKSQKLYWGLDTKERWERKSNM